VPVVEREAVHRAQKPMTPPLAVNSASPASYGYLTTLWTMLGEVIAARSLLYQFIRRDLRIRYKQAILGCAWGLFMPMLIVAGGLVARAAMGRLAGESMLAGLGAVIVKSIPWAFFVGAISFATTSLAANVTVVTKIYFPRAVLPLSAVIAQGVDALVASAVAAFALVLIGIPVSPALLWVPLLLALILTLTAAGALFFSCMNLFFRDVKYIVQVILTFGIFFTPVFFDTAMFGSQGARLLMLNPLTPLLEGLRLSILHGHNLALPLATHIGRTSEIWSPWFLVYGASWSIGGFVFALLIFRRLEFLFAEYI
jgi:lipopolysaccharide transport system permease protein